MAHEIYACSKCKHPNVLESLGLAEFHGHMCLVSPWMEYGTVLQYLISNPSTDRYQTVRQSFSLSYSTSLVTRSFLVRSDIQRSDLSSQDENCMSGSFIVTSRFFTSSFQIHGDLKGVRIFTFVQGKYLLTDSIDRRISLSLSMGLLK